jgi:signal transduction histidine kinase
MVKKKEQFAAEIRWFLVAYAIVTIAYGVWLVGWGPMWYGGDLDGVPYGRNALVRVAGSVVVAAGLVAFGISTVQHPRSLRRALLWFAMANTVVYLVANIQRHTIMTTDRGLTTVEVFTGGTILAMYMLWQSIDVAEPAIWQPLAFLSGPLERDEEVLSAYAEKLREAASQAERHRLARELHDSVKQQLFVVQTAAATAQARFEADAEGAQAAIARVREATREAMTELEALLEQMRASPMELNGMVEALRQQCEAIGFRTGAAVDFHLGSLPPNEGLAPGAAQTIFRAAQEALSNVARHARATKVEVSLDAVSPRFTLRVKDNGSGFDTNSAPRGMGLANLRSRANELGGEYELLSMPGCGTTVEFTVPFSIPDPQRLRRKVIYSAIWLLVSLLVAWKLHAVGLAGLSGAIAVVLIRDALRYQSMRQQSGKPS